VTLLLGTHALLWFLQGDPSLSATAKALIEDPAIRKLASCWEISIKAGLGRMGLVEPVSVLLARELPANNFDLLAITLAHATAVETLPQHHKDPFDRLLIVQAQIERVPIVSADITFDPYGVSRLW
jgi:PIN domain nuclease of toxin-antitoxin system